MSGKAKKITTVFLFVAALGASAGYYLWNKPHVSVSGARGVKIEAAILYNSFIGDSVAANKNFVQQVLEVSGTVSAVSKNQQNQTIVLFKTAIEGASVNCTFEEQVDTIIKGSSLKIKGICSGMGQGDADLGIMGDVYLVRCYLAK